MRFFTLFALGASCCLIAGDQAAGRGGFGGARVGGGGYSGGFGGERSFSGGAERSVSGYGGERNFSGSSERSYSGWGDRGYSGERSSDSYSGERGSAYGGSYDRSWTGARGTTIDTSGTRGAAEGRYGGAAVGGTRDTTIDTAGGRTFSSSRDAGAAVGPYGRTVGGSTRSVDGAGPRGEFSGSSANAFAGNRYTGDFGLSHYSTFNAAAAGHSTAFWSHDYMTTHAGYVRGNFGYSNAFRPGWYTNHPGCWLAAGWAAGTAWTAIPWVGLSAYCGYPALPINYDYGNTVVFNNNEVYIDGEAAGTPEQFAQQATTLADAGQKANAPPEQEWKALGVFALVQGDEKSSNNIFQIAINKDGVIRGNFYDGLTDNSTPIYGSVDKKTQRAAWTIGKKNDRVFEAGVYNLTQGEAPTLVHIGTDRTVQMLLVRVDDQKASATP